MRLKERQRTGQRDLQVTEREIRNRGLARTAAAEGFVLLKNEGMLPILKGSKIGLYGAGAVKTIKGGTGSGDVNERDSVNIYQGLVNAGYEITSREWLEDYENLYNQARQEWKEAILAALPEYGGKFFQAYADRPFHMPCGSPIDEEKAGNDGAENGIFVISRVSGEGADRHDVKGDYYITDEEKALLSQVCACYEKVLLVVNTGGIMDLSFVDEFPEIASILQFVQAGQEGGNALGDVLTGDVTPGGKMTDTWALDYYDYPNASSFSFKNGDVWKEKYREGIYVGYRYFDTFEIPVRYCFGYGLSYTAFSIRPREIRITGLKGSRPMVKVGVLVENIGKVYSGREVVQIYVSCPQGRLPKEFRRLAGFGKTGLLAPGEIQSLSISFPLEELASYFEESASWILEEGSYGIWIGDSLDSSTLAGSLKLDREVTVTRCEHICPRKEKLEEILPDVETLKIRENAWNKRAASLPVVEIRGDEIKTRTVCYESPLDDLSGRAGEIVNSLSMDQLVELATGDLTRGQSSQIGDAGQMVPGSAAQTSAAAELPPWNVAAMALADGPAGLRLRQSYQVVDGKALKVDFFKSLEGGLFAPEGEEKKGETWYQFCTAIPVGTLLAQTWDTDLVKRVGEMMGREMELFQVSLWLAPGMNIHRNPLCGRNFEYYSEDPLLSGMISSAMTLGVQKVPGCGTTIKHFACNNQEDNRLGSDSVVSERALREIYLKGFEIAVRNSQPMCIMTSYNLINGVHSANSYDLCTKAARDEWGFAGAIMTDWTTTTASTAGECTASGCMRAGNDLVMPGNPEDHENLRREVMEGTLKVSDLKRCVCRTVEIALSSNRYEDARSYLDQFEGLDTWMQVE